MKLAASLWMMSVIFLIADRSMAEDVSPIVASEFIYEEAPFPQCHASTIAETPAGLVVALFGGTREKDPDVGIWVARHVDGKWTAPVEVADGVQHKTLRHPCWNPVLVQQPDGPLHLFYKCGPSPSTWWGMHMTSDNHGKTWSRPVRLPDTIDGPVKNKPLLLDDGTLICGSSTEYDGWRVHFEITRDWGQSWERIGPINDGKEFNAIQPSILIHKDGKLQILCRSKEGNVVTSWSADQGQTWSPVERTSLPNPNSGTDAVTLADGRHLIVYNHTPKGRSPLNVAISDDGVDWKPLVVLEDEPGEYSYPAVIQTADGQIHITYTWKRQKVKHVVLGPSSSQAALQGSPAKESPASAATGFRGVAGQSAGPCDWSSPARPLVWVSRPRTGRRFFRRLP